MSKKSNVNPNHYKTRGRDRQGEDILQETHKQEYRQAQTRRGPKESLAPPAPQIEKDSEAGETKKVARKNS